MLGPARAYIWCALTFLTCLCSSLQADDIDIYNSGRFATYPPYQTNGDIAPPNPNYPNILFLLDASWSMRATDPGQVGSRLTRLRAAFNEILANSEKINIAVMRFSHKHSGARVLYPMSPIEFARDEVKEIVDTLVLDWWTPSVHALLEGALYYRGEEVFFGKTRTTRIGYRNHRNERFSRVSHPESYTGGNVVRDPRCTDANLDHASCITEQITGTPMYRSPILHACQSNHIIFISDGAASEPMGATPVIEMTGQGCTRRGKNGVDTCGPEIASFLANTDQAPSIAGDNRVITHTVGFNTSLASLEQIAAAGNGNYYESSSASELADAIAELISDAAAPATTFSQPSVTPDPDSLLANRSDTYLTLFEPAITPVWPGNLKGYWFDGQLLDYSNPRIPVLDASTGAVADAVKSQWSTFADGNSVTAGGAASRLTGQHARILVTNHPTGTRGLMHESNRINSDNISADQLGLPDPALGLAASDLDTLLAWAHGADVHDVNNNDDQTDNRRQYGDPLHSNPRIVTYGRNANNQFESVIFFGTNEGFLHAVDSLTGQDLYSFLPWSLRENLKTSFRNLPFSEKLYGLDGQLTIWLADDNNNGFVDDANDHAYLYAGMRRGGRNYYAINVTDKANPELLWRITGGEGEFAELGQTWSKPVHGRMTHPTTGDTKNVVVFSGGYDDGQDDVTVRTPDQQGRAIYIVDAVSGDLIWNAGPSNATLNLPDMLYSIPATPEVIDLDGDGMFDQIYAGDMGGQIWRFDVARDGTIDGGRIANLTGSDTTLKRFFSTPDAVLVKPEHGDVYLAISLGSGTRSQPLSLTENNTFYSIKQTDFTGPPEGYGYKTDDGSYIPLQHQHLVDVTDNSIVEGDADERERIEGLLAQRSGWYVDMEQSGEKILNPSVTADNKVLFTSYIPGTQTLCSIDPGSSFLYALNIFDGRPVSDSDGDGIEERAERRTLLSNSGISAPPVIMFSPGTETSVHAVIGAESQPLSTGPLIKRTNWSEAPDH